jgi:glycosyltransferase involved in cell wall biosynthesis
MNIIFVMNAYHPVVGGVEKAAAYLARELGRLDCKVTVVAARNPISLPEFEVVDSISVYRLPYYVYRDSLKSAIASFIGMPIACFKLIRLALQARPCICHVHFLYHNAVCVELIRGFLKRFGIPVIVSFHGGDAPNIPKTYIATHTSESMILNWAAKRLLVRSDALTAVSKDRREAILSAIPDKNLKIKVINNGVDTKVFAPRPVEERDAILAVGTLTHAKGYDVMLRAFAQIAGRHSKWKLKIAGDGELKKPIIKLASLLGISEKVHFLGSISTDRVVSEINQSAFVVSASRWEGFSLAALEALSCGKPLITTDVPGAREMMVDGVTGVIVPRENPEALARAMEKLINDRQARTRMGKSARQYIVSRFTWENVAKQYRDLYESVMKLPL